MEFYNVRRRKDVLSAMATLLPVCTQVMNACPKPKGNRCWARVREVDRNSLGWHLLIPQRPTRKAPDGRRMDISLPVRYFTELGLPRMGVRQEFNPLNRRGT